MAGPEGAAGEPAARPVGPRVATPPAPRLGSAGCARGERLFGGAVTAAALGLAGLVGLLTLCLVYDAWPAIRAFGPAFFWTSTWNPVTHVFGVLPAIYGTLITSALALLLAAPIGIGSGLFLAEFAPLWLARPLGFLIELLAAIPSVVIGLWGLFVVVPTLRPVEEWLGTHLDFLPLFQGPPTGLGILAAGLVLAIMVLPILTAIVREVVRAVPTAQREGAYALGATEWEIVAGVVLPYSHGGIFGALVLALGRALGETLAVTMVIGNTFKIDVSLFSQSITLASLIASEFREADSDLYLASLMYAGLALLLITLVVNLGARLLVHRMSHGAIGLGQGAG